MSNLGEFVTDDAFEAIDFVAYLRDHLLAIPQHQLLNLCRCQLFLKLINALEAAHAAGSKDGRVEIDLSLLLRLIRYYSAQS